jgi:hypothetical protein
MSRGTDAPAGIGLVGRLRRMLAVVGTASPTRRRQGCWRLAGFECVGPLGGSAALEPGAGGCRGVRCGRFAGRGPTGGPAGPPCGQREAKAMLAGAGGASGRGAGGVDDPWLRAADLDGCVGATRRRAFRLARLGAGPTAAGQRRTSTGFPHRRVRSVVVARMRPRRPAARQSHRRRRNR